MARNNISCGRGKEETTNPTEIKEKVSLKITQPDRGNIILYQTEDGQAAVDVCLAEDTVWLKQAKMVELFQLDQSVISSHINNVPKEVELHRQGNMQKMHIANSDKPVAF